MTPYRKSKAEPFLKTEVNESRLLWIAVIQSTEQRILIRSSLRQDKKLSGFFYYSYLKVWTASKNLILERYCKKIHSISSFFYLCLNFLLDRNIVKFWIEVPNQEKKIYIYIHEYSKFTLRKRELKIKKFILNLISLNREVRLYTLSFHRIISTIYQFM